MKFAGKLPLPRPLSAGHEALHLELKLTAIISFIVPILHARSPAVNRTRLMEIATKLVRTIVIQS